MGKAILLAVALVLASSPEHQLLVIMSTTVYTLVPLSLLDSV